MIHIILAVLFSLPVPPLGATLSSNVQKTHNAPVVSEMERTELSATGLATYYANGVFEQVLRNRGLPADGCPDCDGYAALLWPADLDRVVCVEGLRLWVVDVAAGHHRAGLIIRNWVIDIDRESWLALGWPDAPTKTKVTECS